MTLVELMVTLAIVTTLMGAGMYSMGLVGRSDLKSEAMRLTSSIKYTWNRAAMNNAQYRMVFQLDGNSYHTEVTDAPVVSKKRASEEESERFLSEEARRAQEQDEQQNSLFDEEESDPFNVNRKTTYKKVEDDALESHTLPDGMVIERVIPCDREEVITRGKAAIRFYPNGFQEPVIVVMRSGKDTYFSLKTEPLTGRVKLYSKKLEKTEDCGQPQEIQEEW